MKRLLVLIPALGCIALIGWVAVSLWALFAVRQDPRNDRLIEAAWRNDLTTVRAALAQGANANALDGWALYGAADKGYTAMVQFLLTKGANPNVRSHAGDSALDRAAFSGHVSTAQVLIKHGAQVGGRDNYHRETPLMWAATGHQPDTLALFLHNGAPVSARDYVGRTALLYLFEDQPSDGAACRCATLLIRSGADVNARSQDGKTALMWAAEQQLPQTARFLLAVGADRQLRDNSHRIARDWLPANKSSAMEALFR